MKHILSLALVTWLAACGGGGSDPVVVDTEVPASATRSSDAYVAYTQAMVRTVDDAADALSLAMVDAPPTSDTADPVDFD